jgi:RNA polymerase sigma factor (sigma-70 family)
MNRAGEVAEQVRQMLEGENLGGLGDAQLLECFLRAGAEEAFAVLVRRHGPLVLSVCRRALQNSHDAEDAFQATFLVLARRAASLRQPGSLASWLYGIALRLARTMKRDAATRRRLEQQVPPPAPQAPPDPGQQELYAILDEEVQRLPQNNRQPLLLCDLEGLSQEEAARQLGWPRGTLKRRLERGRSLLEKRLKQRGLAPAAVPIAALPAALESATVKAAVAFAARQAVCATLASARVVTLAEGVLRTMLAAKVKLLSLLVLILGLGTLGALVWAQPAHQPADARVAPPADGEEKEPAAKPPEDPATATATIKRFEELAAQLKMFPTVEFAYGRAGRPDQLIPKAWTEPWLKVHASLAACKDDVQDLVGLLKHKDPRVRTLAVAALFERQDPRVLPHLAALVSDKEKTVPEVSIRRALVLPNEGLLPQDFHEQTVGRVATVLLDYWLQPAGHSAKDFDAYWAARKDRAYCASWFLVRLYRAGQASSHFEENRAPLIRAVRKEVDALPAEDRDWVLLWLGAHHLLSTSERPRQIFATTQDLLDAGKRLGPDRLMDLFEGKPISKDPDLAPKEVRTRGRDDLGLWALRHAGRLFRPEDATAILALEGKLRDRTPWCALAAAELQPAKARDWLRAAIGRFAGEPVYTHLAWSRAELAAGLWRIVGESEIDYLADWFYGEKVNSTPHSTQTGMFLDRIQGVRAPADRKLVARLVTDPRLEKLDYQSLRALAEVANGWTKTPVLEREKLRPIWEKGTWGPETDRDLKVLTEWREKLKKSVPDWNPAKMPPE